MLWPQVTVTSPSNGTTLTVGDAASVTATADASVGDAALASVDLAVDGTVIGTDNAPPFAATWTVTTGIHTFTATAHYAQSIDATSEPITAYGGVTSGTLAVTTHTWQPNPANVGDVITGAVTAAIDPAALDGDGSGPTYVDYAWTTAGVWRSDDGTAQTFVPYSGDYVIGYTGTGPSDEFHATFMVSNRTKN